MHGKSARAPVSPSVIRFGGNMFEIVLAVFSAVLGSILSIGIPVIVTNRQYNRRHEFFGKWKSSYQSLDRPDAEWVNEEVDIDLHIRRFRIRNYSNEAKYDYIAYADLIDRTYLKGSYRSNRPGANAFGALVLTIAPRGDLLYGFWIGPNDTGERRYGGWVLGRTNDDIDRAKELLQRSSPLFVVNSK